MKYNEIRKEEYEAKEFISGKNKCRARQEGNIPLEIQERIAKKRLLS